MTASAEGPDPFFENVFKILIIGGKVGIETAMRIRFTSLLLQALALFDNHLPANPRLRQAEWKRSQLDCLI